MIVSSEDDLLRDFRKLEDIFAHAREQRESVAGKDTPFRVEFRYRGGTRHYQYFTDVKSAKNARDRSCRYGTTGRVMIEEPLSQQIQVRGPRCGWKAYKE